MTYAGDGNFTGASSSDYVFNVTKGAVVLSSADVKVVYGANGTIIVVFRARMSSLKMAKWRLRM